MVKYTFYDQNNPDTRISFVCKFKASPEGIAEEAMRGGFVSEVYPNPATNSFRINKNVQKIEIFDHTGRMITSFSGDFYPDQEYDTTFLKPSIYFLRISSEQGSSSKRLIIE